MDDLHTAKVVDLVFLFLDIAFARALPAPGWTKIYLSSLCGDLP
jgi:hypothetical protein